MSNNIIMENPANGAPTPKRRGRPSSAPVSDVLQEVREARKRWQARLHEIEAARKTLDAEHAEIEAALGIRVSPGPDVVAKQVGPTRLAPTKRAARKSAKTASKPRGHRADSLPSKILALLSGSDAPYAASEIAKQLDVKGAKIHGALAALAKSAKVKSEGEGRDRTWSLA